VINPGYGVPPAPPRPPKDPMMLVEGPGPTTDARRRIRLSIILGATGILTTILLPVGLLLDLAAIVIGVRGWRLARSAGIARRGDLLGPCLGGTGLLLAAALVALIVTLWTPLSRWTDCVSGANTTIAEHTCKERLRAEVRDRIGHDVPGLG
jgi:hypothetical protein